MRSIETGCMIKRNFLILNVVFIIFACCKPEDKTKLSQHKEVVVIQNKDYYNGNGFKMANFHYRKDRLYIDLYFNEDMDTDNYFKELESVFEQAIADQFQLKKLRRILLEIFRIPDKFALEFNRIKEIQEEMIRHVKAKKGFLDHKYMAESLKKSNTIQTILNLLPREYLTIKNMYLDKCRASL